MLIHSVVPSEMKREMSLASNFLSEDQFRCSICLDIFTNPVSILCGHSFCMACLGGYWDSTDLYLCPLCKEPFERKPKLCINRSFSEVTEVFKKMRASGTSQPVARPGEVACDICAGPRLRAVQSCLACLASFCQGHVASHSARYTKHTLVDPIRNLEDRMCKQHERLLDLFCESDQSCICLLCAKSDHREHSIIPLEEAVQEFKTQVERSMADVQHMVQERMKKVEEIKHSVEISKESAEREIADSVHILAELVSSISSSQAQLLEIMEERQKAAERQAERFINHLHQEISELKRRSTELEQLSHTKDYLHFLQNFQSLSTPPCSKDWSEITVQADVSVGTVRTAISQIEETLKKLQRQLSESDLKKAQQHAVDITLDPSTANCWLVLSEDRKQVKEGNAKLDVPDSPERFDVCICILGKEGFSSGRRYWEVHVGEKTEWDLGVARESINRKGNIPVSPAEGYWTMCLRDGNQYSFCGELSIALPRHVRPQTIGVYVDYEAGQISFYDVEASSHIYTFNGTFTEKLYPFFSPYLSSGDNAAPLIIRPVGHTD
ncbi:hypothetical protein JZ751_005935 [Albula glossodonta]|uniref:E3 ubiquitin-protein ligase TRIM39-like n=1 Tax=Albula glossodonta TaxID=121402 RepID=A0A8T2PBW8_9TELE|nr:hypothetical protein JZ751_005935 [Albula glossodonta]